MDDRELNVLTARIALECERYLEVIEALQPVFMQKIELTSDELCLLQEAFQKLGLNLRLNMYSINEKKIEAEEEGSNQKLNLIQNYLKKLELEFNQRLVECSKIIHEYIYPYTDNNEVKVQLLLMQIRFWVRLSNIARGPAQVSAISNTHILFKYTTRIADAHLKITNPLRLELVCLFCNFLHEWLENPREALRMGRQVHEDWIDQLGELNEENYKASSNWIVQIETVYRHASHFVNENDGDPNGT